MPSLEHWSIWSISQQPGEKNSFTAVSVGDKCTVSVGDAQKKMCPVFLQLCASNDKTGSIMQHEGKDGY